MAGGQGSRVQDSGGSSWASLGWVLGARTHPIPHKGTGKSETPRQSHSWAPGTFLETGKMQVQTRLKAHNQAGSGCGDLKTGPGAAPLGQGMTALRIGMGSWAMGS